MSYEYQLIVETDEKNNMAEFRLLDEKDVQKGDRQVRLPEHTLSFWEGLFDTRNYVDRYAGNMDLDDGGKPATEEELLNRLGVFLGREVLGEGIMKELERGGSRRRTLLVRLPETSENSLAAAFARVPWEIARMDCDKNPLMHRNIIIRMVTEDTSEPDGYFKKEAKRVESGEAPLKVLFVFAETSESSPLAMRLEREKLRSLFINDILPSNRVQADFLCHGVTRETLWEQITRADGYHMVHWSGHGHHNVLELQGDNGRSFITGMELVELFEEAGGLIPQFVFLSACLSGAFVNVSSWEELQAVLAGERKGRKKAEEQFLPKILREEKGYTGTALALLQSGVSQVAAMRYEVGDDYARELAIRFYQRFLADSGKRGADAALAMARSDLLKDREEAQRLGAINHVTPLMFGRPGRILNPAPKRGEQMDRLWPRPWPLLPDGNRELEPVNDFTGRSRELTELNVKWRGKDGPATALIQGLAGMGKTALASESIHLWHTGFDWVLAFQAKPSALHVDDFFRKIHSRLSMKSKVYLNRCNDSPYSRIYLDAEMPMPSGENRYEHMRANLLDALRQEAVLIVLDNFENNLKKETKEEGYPCRDPEWDAVLSALASELPAERSRSRVLVTCRHLPKALAGKDTVLWIRLGPLPIGEAALFVKNHQSLGPLACGKTGDMDLLKRLLSVSRGHPLIMDRLASLARVPASLGRALEKLEKDGFRDMPDLFARRGSEEEREKERNYLEEVAVGSVDYLLKCLSGEARSLLWVVTQANEPVAEGIIRGVWSGETVEDEQLGKIRELMKFDESLRKRVSQLPPEIREILENPEERKPVPKVGPLLDELLVSGLLTRESAHSDGDAPSGVQQDESGAEILKSPGRAGDTYAFHELVRERADQWMKTHESETGGRTRESVWIAFGERYAAIFNELQTSGQKGAMDKASEAGRRALVYIVRAGAYEKLGSFAGDFVTGTRNPALLKAVIDELKEVAVKVPPGETRWSLRRYLGDAFWRSGRPDQSLPFYEQAAKEAEAAGDWSNVGWITGNWGGALLNVGLYDKSKEAHLKSAEANKKAGKPKADIIGPELEALRIDVYKGEAKEALPEIETRLDEAREWWKRRKKGEAVEEAPDDVFLGRLLVGGLNIANYANQQLKNWEACLSLLEEIEQTERESGIGDHELNRTRFNRHGPLMELGRLEEARKVVEECLAVDREADDSAGQGRGLSALASIWDEQGDMGQAVAVGRRALAVRNELPDPAERAESHLNLSNYLEKDGKEEEAARHFLAAGVYILVSGREDYLKVWMGNLAVRWKRDGQYGMPRIAELVALGEFEALKRFLVGFKVDLEALQGRVDEIVEGVGE